MIRFSVTSPNFKITTFLFFTAAVWSKGGYTCIANTCKEAFRVFILCITPPPPTHDFSHKIIENRHFIWCATSPSVQWVIASYEAIHRQWVKTSKMGARFLPSAAWVWRFPLPSWGPRSEWCQSKPLRSCQSLHCPPPATEKQQCYGANTTMVKEDWMTDPGRRRRLVVWGQIFSWF